MSNLTVLISDDEPLAIARLAELVRRMDRVELVGEATDGREALDLIDKLRPTLVLLDIEMPILDGFDVIEHLSASLDDGMEDIPLFIFITAYPQFAVRAFETGALDFIPKPVRYTRLVEAFDRARLAAADREARHRLALLGTTLDQLRREREQLDEEDHHLWVPRHGEIVRVDCDQINWVAAEGEYVRLHTDDQSYLFRQMIGEFVAQHATIGFLRVHRSAAVNIARIVAIRRSSNGSRRLRLNTGEEIPVGRKFAKDVMSIISRESA